MKSSDNDIINKWINIAAADLKMAELAGKNGLYLHSAFHCQQCIEKSLKALIISELKKEPPYTHDLVRLYELLSKSKIYNEDNKVMLATLNPFYIQSRYPSYRISISQDLTKKKVLAFIKIAKEVLKWLEKKPK